MWKDWVPQSVILTPVQNPYGGSSFHTSLAGTWTSVGTCNCMAKLTAV